MDSISYVARTVALGWHNAGPKDPMCISECQKLLVLATLLDDGYLTERGIDYATHKIKFSEGHLEAKGNARGV